MYSHVVFRGLPLQLSFFLQSDRRMLECNKLIDEWITSYAITLRPKLNPRRFKAAKPDWWKAFDVTPYGAQWGTEVAAEKLSRYP